MDIDDCSSFATCKDLGSNGYECSCNDGYADVENSAVGTQCQLAVNTGKTCDYSPSAHTIYHVPSYSNFIVFVFLS